MQRRPERARLADVARLAGVSPSTVSRVLSNPDVVAAGTREAVMAAVALTGYRVNHAARNLRKQRTGVVVALVPDLGNPFFAKILDGMGRELACAGYDLLVADTLDAAGRHRSLQSFLDPSRADGIILLDGMVPLGNLPAADGVPPVICACEWIEDTGFPRVMLDNREGGRLAVAHLHDLGHRRIGVICGPPGNVLNTHRLEGARSVVDDPVLFAGDFTLQAGRRAADEFLAMPPAARPTAVFAFSDAMACAFLGGLQRGGILAPRDLSLVGFDDIELASHLCPALTTIRQPKRDLGQRAAQVIVNRIEGRPFEALTLLEPRLMLRETTGAPSRRNGPGLVQDPKG